MTNQVVLEDLEGSKAYKEFRRLYSVNQLIRKFAMHDNKESNKYYYVGGQGFLVGANKSNIHAEVTMFDAPVLKSIPYFELDADRFFEWEKTNKKCNSIVWNNGSLTLSAINFETGEGNDPYTTHVSQVQVKKHIESRQRTLEYYVNNPNVVYTITNDARFKDNTNGIMYYENLLDIMDVVDLFPSTCIGFSNNPKEPLVVMNQMSNDAMDKRLDADVVTFMHLPKKWLFKFEKGDIFTITIKRITKQRYVAMFNSVNKRYGKRQFIEFNIKLVK